MKDERSSISFSGNSYWGKKGDFVEIGRGAEEDAGGRPPPDIVVDSWLEPLALVRFGTIFFVFGF